jgi:hypothetical protein
VRSGAAPLQAPASHPPSPLALLRPSRPNRRRPLVNTVKTCPLPPWFLLSAENHRYFRNFSYIRRVR